MIEYELIPDSSAESEDDYPEHVKEKIEAYKKAKLRYKVNEDGNMLRSIAFHRVKKIKPEKYYRTIKQILRLRTPDKSKEYIVYRTHEGAFDGGDKEHNDSITYGVTEYLHTQPQYSTSTGNLSGRTPDVHKNVFTIEYSKKKIEEILDSRIPRKFKNEEGEEEVEELENPQMMIGIASFKYPTLWESDEGYGIHDLESFVTEPFDNLLLMGMTGENSMREAMTKANRILSNMTLDSETNTEIRKLAEKLSNSPSSNTKVTK